MLRKKKAVNHPFKCLNRFLYTSQTFKLSLKTFKAQDTPSWCQRTSGDESGLFASRKS